MRTRQRILSRAGRTNFWTRNALIAALLLVTSCRTGDQPVPWDKTEIVRDLTAELRRFEHVTADLADVEVLAWRRMEQKSNANPFPFPPNAPVAMPVERVHLDKVLLWARTDAADRFSWLLIHGYRAPDAEDHSWHRGVIFRDLIQPSSTPLWPGETPDRTWHGIQRLDHTPTSQEICAFADVDFLRARVIADWHTVSTAIQIGTWIPVAGTKPECEIVW